MKKLTEKLQNAAPFNNDLANQFNEIIISKIDNYGKNLNGLKSFFHDLQQGGCISGMIGDFIYHSDCKEFYIKNIDELEEYFEELQENLGAIINANKLPHYTFICWLCFEEYCFSIYSNLFEN